jgi:hypothetical protein
MSLWSFRDDGSSNNALISGADRVEPAQQVASRLDRLVSISESATPAAVEAAFPDGYNWYYPWAARLIELRKETSQIAMQSNGAAGSSQVKSATEQQIAHASDRLDVWLETCDETLDWTDVEPSFAVSDSRALVTEPPMDLTGGHWVHGVAEGGEPVLAIERHSLPTAGQARAGAVALVAVVAAATLSLLRRPAAWDVVYRWPHAFVFLLGIAYWAALRPSWLGIAIAAASLLLALWTGWPGRLMRREGSTVVRIMPR